MNDRGRNNLRLGELFLVCPKYPDLQASTPAKFSDHTPAAVRMPLQSENKEPTQKNLRRSVSVLRNLFYLIFFSFIFFLLYLF